jgi:hypothetical protein
LHPASASPTHPMKATREGLASNPPKRPTIASADMHPLPASRQSLTS